jgi:glycosyltransferase involved in cell wall biosynthesis
MDVTVVLNAYRRLHTIDIQIAAIKAQTYPVREIMLWQNYHSNENTVSEFSHNLTKHAECNHNFGVWARFAYALNAKTKYVCIIDDDTIPGSEWIENCITTMKTNRGLLGCRGVRMSGEDYRNYPGCKYESICGNHDNIEQVDIMGHCWFFERDWLRYYWFEAPNIRPNYGGEDMHFSYVLQKHLGLNTYVPAQPSNNKEMWGSLYPSKYGEDDVATSRTINGFGEANMYWNHLLNKGYKLVKDQK